MPVNDNRLILQGREQAESLQSPGGTKNLSTVLSKLFPPQDNCALSTSSMQRHQTIVLS